MTEALQPDGDGDAAAPSGGRGLRTPAAYGRAFRVLFVVFLYYLASLAVLDAFMGRWAMGDNWRKSRFNRVVHYTAERPFAYRVLTPWLINTVSGSLPETWAAGLGERAELLRERYGLRQGNDTAYFTGYLLLLASLLGTLVLWRALLRHFRFPPAWRDLAPPLLLLFYPVAFAKGGFVYDFPELFLASAAFLLFLRRSWWLYYPTFAVAILNKESAALMAVWFLAAFTVDRRFGRLLAHAAASAAVGLPVLFAVRTHFADSPGRPMSLNLRHNLEYLSNLGSYFTGADVYATGLPVPQGLHLVNLVLLLVLVALSRRSAPPLVWWVFVDTVLVILPLFVAFGFEDELRVFAPAFPALFLLAVFTLRQVYEARAHCTDRLLID